MSQTHKTLKELHHAGHLDDVQLGRLQPVADHYAIGLTKFLGDHIDANDPNDPIRKMFIPDTRELENQSFELIDPIGDEIHSPVPGIVHRYPNRVLFKPVGVCPVYCRFCFRREMVGPFLGDTLNAVQIEAALDYVHDHKEITEVILTGGDPFMLSAARAAHLTQRLSDIPHLEVIRWHTRMPVADPIRIDTAYSNAIATTNKAVFVAVHINHIKELSDETKAATTLLQSNGIQTVSQTVLLKDVNDHVDILSELMQGLLAASIRPYLLHHPDLARGTGHFWVDVEDGQRIYQDLKDQISGLALPRYVIDIPGGISKANAAPPEVFRENGKTFLRGRDGKKHQHKQ